MNYCFIMTDTQNKSMVGAYGNPAVDTPNLDRLAEEGVRFERAYTACPLCTPARGSLFSGLHPQVNGAWMNNVAPYGHVPLMGEIFAHYGYRTAYTGKWHLDGSAYFGDGVPGGGFEPDWWYDGKRYAEDIGPEMFAAYRSSRDTDALRRAGFCEDNIWGHRVADRAIDFLKQAGEDAFVLAVSFDEPHGPFVAPPEYWESFDMSGIPMRPNFGASTADKPGLQQIHNQERPVDPRDWEGFRQRLQRHYACNAYIDREIGRVIDAVERLHGDDTTIIYTSDHGGIQGSHSLHSKGPMMYDEICNVPLIVKAPGVPRGAVSQAVVSHVDILPTMLDLASLDVPESLHGVSLAPALRDPNQRAREAALVNFHRFAINHDSYGEFYPIRSLTDGRYKLAINLLDSDEFYDLERDPFEMENRIQDPACAADRDRLHDALLAEMDRIRDPFRSFRWGDRAWRSVRQTFYSGGPNRPLPQGFPFQARPPLG